jgi:hypothetical protein
MSLWIRVGVMVWVRDNALGCGALG